MGKQINAGLSHRLFAFDLIQFGFLIPVRVMNCVYGFKDIRAVPMDTQGMHPNLLTCVSAKQRAILNESHLQSLRTGGERGAASGHPPSDYYEIE